MALSESKLALGAAPPRISGRYEWQSKNRSAHGGGVGTYVWYGIARVRPYDLSRPEESGWRLYARVEPMSYSGASTALPVFFLLLNYEELPARGHNVVGIALLILALAHIWT